MMFILEHFGYILVLSLLSILAFVVNEMYIAGKYIKKCTFVKLPKKMSVLRQETFCFFI